MKITPTTPLSNRAATSGRRPDSVRYVLIANPRSGQNRGQLSAEAAAQCLRDLGAEAEIRFTDGPGRASELAADAANDCDRLLSVGGDGTLNEVLAGLPPHDRPAVGMIPVGTANVLAREIGLALRHPDQAARALHHGRIVSVHHGLANDRPFLANVSCGFDAAVVHELTERRRAQPETAPGMKGYFPVGLKLWRGWTSPEIRVRVDGEALDGSFSEVAVCRTRNYGGIMELTPQAELGEPGLWLAARRSQGRRGVLRHLAWGLLGWEDSPRAVVYRRGREIEIEGNALAQVDGDPFGAPPLRLRLAPEPLHLLVPR